MKPAPREGIEVERIGPYRLESCLGSGGMGTVWRAWDERLRRPVATKRVHSEADANTRERLRREARAVARLNHPAIVHIYDLLEREDGDWIVMELVAGRTLRKLLAEEGALSAPAAIQLGLEITEGLAEAHAQGILHRDLKATNVMVTPAGRAKILDFGLAKDLGSDDRIAEGEPTLSAPGTLLGTIHAMSPEQIQGLPLDARSDLFSLGSLLYEILTGEPPFRADSPGACLARVLTFQPAPLHEIRPACPRELSDLVRRLLEKDPRDRPQSAGEVAGALASLSPSPARAWEGRTAAVTAAATATVESETAFTWVEAPRRPSGERRRLTVACCGLVGVDLATGETCALDVEALSESMAALQNLAQEAARELGGSMGGLLGSIVWLCFGYPQFHEDNAGRAVRAARLLAEKVGQLPVQPGGRRRPAVRIAVHSGLAVVESRHGQPGQLQLGSTLDLAMGLQGAAPVNQVVVSAASHRLLARAFAMEGLPPVHLPGVDGLVPLYRVVAALDPKEGGGTSVTSLVAREWELALLLDHLRLACSGAGQAVMISGEAGIGKSRLVRALRDEAAAEAATWLVGHGSPYTQRTPFAPVVELMQRALFSAGESPRQKLSRIEALVRRFGLPPADNVPLLAALLSVPTDGRYPALVLRPEVQRRKTLEAIVVLLTERAQQQPLVLLFEDLHWIDPSTLDLLELVVEQLSALPLLLLTTFRPELQAPWKKYTRVTQISLGRLTDEQADALIGRLVEGRELAAGMRQQIVARTDGIPLFVEELTKAVLEAEWTGEQPDIPSTLDGSLMARLNRLGDAKEVAQIASVIGRRFSVELLAAVSELDPAVLQRGIAELLQAELIYRRGASSRASYVFKHALIQDAAYLSLLSSRRQEIHERIAHTLEADLAAGQDIEPEVLALHFERAGLIPQAASYLQRTALRALQTSSCREALSHCGRGIELLESLPTSPAARVQELDLRYAMGLALAPLKGYSSMEVEENAARTHTLCEEIGDTPRLIPPLYMLWLYHRLRGARHPTLELAERIGRLAKDAEEHLFVGYSVRGVTAYYRGALREATGLLEQAVAMHGADLHLQIARTFGEEASLLPHFYYARSLWLSGRPEEGARKKDETRRMVEALCSPYMLAEDLFWEMTWWHQARDPARVEPVAQALIELCREQRLPFFKALAECGYGWALTHRGEGERGIPMIQTGLDNHAAMGNRLSRGCFLTYLAEAWLVTGRFQEGLQVIDEALALTSRQLDTFHDAELHRLRGDLLLGAADPAGAETAFRQALGIARAQEAVTFERRAAESLARLLGESS